MQRHKMILFHIHQLTRNVKPQRNEPAFYTRTTVTLSYK